MKRFLVLALITFAAACGGGGSSDDTVTPDAEVTDQPDAPPAPICLADATYGAATLANQQGGSNGPAATPNRIVVVGALNADAAPDGFELQLYKGYGAFTAGEIVAGTYPITGDELNFATCGVCPLVAADLDQTAGPAQIFYATGGSVTITATSPNIVGSVSNLTYVEVTIDEATAESTPVPGGCSSGVTSASFDALVTNTP